MQPEVVELPLWQKTWAWFEQNRKQAIWGTGIVVGVVLIYWFFTWQQGEKEISAGEALSDVSSLQMSNPNARAEGAAAYLKVASAYPKSSAAARAVLLAAGSYFSEGKYPEAKALFERFNREHRESGLVGEALLGIAACADAQNQTNEAVVAYKSLVDHHAGEPVIPQAKFALARLYEAQNKLELAHNYYEELNKAEPYSSIGSEAGMRAEELVAKNPSLAPKPLLSPTPPGLVNSIVQPTNTIPLTNSSTLSNSAPTAAPKG